MKAEKMKMKTETLKYGTCQHCNRLVESTRNAIIVCLQEGDRNEV